jgi:hypothetical protein
MVPLVVLMGLNIVVLTMWTIMDTPYWNRVVLQYDPYGRVSESSGSCTSDHMAAYLSPILAINGCALLLALWQAYVGRGITTEFSESKYIASEYIKAMRRRSKPRFSRDADLTII